MPSTLSSQLDLFNESESTNSDEVQMQVWGLLSAFYPEGGPVERRRESRHPFPRLIHLTPVGKDGMTPEGTTTVVVGKDISEHGLGFYHLKPLPYRRMIASVEAPNGQWLGFLIDISWCRFTHQGWYESGGRLLRTVLSPIESAPRS
jgi:hypothetical protein